MKIKYPTPARQPQLRRLWKLAFGDSDAFLDGFYATGYSPDRCRCLIVDNQVAAALYWFDVGEDLAYLYAVATHPDHRGRGFCRALLEDTHRLLAERGYRGALLVPDGETLREMYARFGYENSGGREERTFQAGQDPVAIRQIDPDTFVRLRRTYLPPGGVRQEGPAIRYLATFAQFYAGADFLLVAGAREDQLHGIELLGNVQAVPGILRALGYARGKFSLPGDAPFAMYRRLNQPGEAPGYFGLDLA